MEHPDGSPGGGQPVENNPGTPSYLNNPPPANHAGHQLPDRTLIDQIHRKIQDLTGSLQQLVSCPSSTFSGSIETASGQNLAMGNSSIYQGLMPQAPSISFINHNQPFNIQHTSCSTQCRKRKQ